MTSSDAAVNYRPAPAILLSILVTAVLASGLNALVALVGRTAGLSSATFTGLAPGPFVALTTIGAIAGAVGWHLFNRFARSPRRTFRWLVPLVLAISFVPDILIGVTTGTGQGWLYATLLIVMHIITAVVAVLVYRRFLPLKDSTPRPS